MFESDSFSLSPIHFFALSSDCRYWPKDEKGPPFSSHSLPPTKNLTGEENFAHVAIGWCEEGIGLQVEIRGVAKQSFYPELERGDCVELFFDTRDMKSAGFNTRFCHHFFFLSLPVEGVVKGEKTRFRTEDSHPLCPSDLLIKSQEVKKNKYTMNIFIPAICLCGYDPEQFNRIGFTYRIHRFSGKPQHFAVLSEEYPIDQHPSLWASLKLCK